MTCGKIERKGKVVFVAGLPLCELMTAGSVENDDGLLFT
jgi:hypothetical protein